MTQISVHLFDLTSESGRDLRELVTRIAHTPKAQRWRHLSNQEVALLETRHVRQTDIYLLDFVKRRAVGPGKIRRNSDIEAFNFEAGENFGEETSAIWDPRRNWLLVQFNLHGVRAASVVNYLNIYDHDPESDWGIAPKLDPGVEARLRSKTLLKAATMKFSLNHTMTDAMRQSGQALGAALSDIGEQVGTATMEVSFSMAKSPGFISDGVRSLMRHLGRNVTEQDGLSSLEVKVRENFDGQDEVINLLQHRIKQAYSSRDLVVVGGRYTLDSRWTALQRVHAGWAQEL